MDVENMNLEQLVEHGHLAEPTLDDFLGKATFVLLMDDKGDNKLFVYRPEGDVNLN